jgi:hypothetical protein
MSASIYSSSDENTRDDFIAPNNITVCRSYSTKLILCKTVYPSSEVAYDNVKYYNFFNRPVQHLQDLFELIKYLLARPQCCVIRGVCVDDSKPKQRRLLYDDRESGEHATVIEQDQNWFALDIDGYGVSSGDLKLDANKVLLALGLSNVEAFAIPSAGYLRKPGIHIRLFLWNSVRVSCLALKKHFSSAKGIVDTALFGPVQPIYTSRPRFIGCSDPCEKWWTWISGEAQHTNVPPNYSERGRSEKRYTAKQAESFLAATVRKMENIEVKTRHNWLLREAILYGQLCSQGLLDDEDTKQQLYSAAGYYWHGDRRKDMETIVDGMKRGYQQMEGNNDSEF